MNSARYIPSNLTPFHSDPELALEVYADAAAIADGAPMSAWCFVGKGSKPRWTYRFSKAADLFRMINETVNAEKVHQAMLAREKAARMAPVNVQVGDVFVSSWGYEQTNVDFYEVTRVVSGHTIEVREIAGQNVKDTSHGSARVVPCPGDFLDKPAMRKRVSGHSDGTPRFRVASYANAYLAERNADGSFKSHYCSWDA
jgi:hypothetical protein